MDGRTDGRTDELIDVGTDGRTDEGTDAIVDSQLCFLRFDAVEDEGYHVPLGWSTIIT